MKRVLLISYGFPPVSRVQSQGAAKLARGLAEHGWEVHVLTVADPPTFLIDPTLLDAVPASVEVHATYSLEPTRLLQLARKLSPRRSSRPASPTTAPAKRSYTSLPPWAVKALRSCFFPDEKIGWALTAVPEAIRLHRRLDFDAIVSTGPPYSDHVIAHRVARSTGLPWLPVLMDPIVGCYAFRPPTPLHARLLASLESKVAKSSSAIAIATPLWADQLLSRRPEAAEKTFVFPNSFEPTDFAGSPPPAHEGFVVAYVGTFQLSVRADDLLDAIVVLRSDTRFARDLRVRFASPTDPQTEAAIDSRGLGDVVVRTGLLPHREAVAEMRSADVLVLVLGPEPESAGILSGKLPEYLAAGRPVLAIVPDGVAADTITRAGAGECARPGDVPAIAKALRRLYDAWAADAGSGPDPQVVACFDRTLNAKRLDAALRAASEGRPLPKEAR